MDIESYRKYCLAKPGVTEEFPFDNNTLVFKVAGKMFALTSLATFESINLKVEPEKGAELREQYPAVRPGYHMNKKHWNTVIMDGSISDKLLLQWIDTSYDLVVNTLSKSQRSLLDK
jgi:predicted DNA-binding protein (MmcQ/YjbR family)